LHDLRHTGLTLAAATGATTAELMHRAGHSSVIVTSIATASLLMVVAFQVSPRSTGQSFRSSATQLS